MGIPEHTSALILIAGLAAAAIVFLLIKRRRRRPAAAVSPHLPQRQPDAFLQDLDNALDAPGSGEIAITRAKTTLGRDPRNDIVLKKATVSTLHATIEYKEPAFYLEDQRSTNGTRLNGRRLPPNMPVRLKSGDRIQLATFGFTFQVPGRIPFADGVMLAMTPLAGPEPGATIVLDLDSADGRQALIGCMQNHLLQLYSLGDKYRSFMGRYFDYPMLSAIAAKAHDCLTQTETDGQPHWAAFVEHQALYLVCSLPVAVSHAAEWFQAQYGGYTRFILHWIKSETYTGTGCRMLCVVAFGQDPATWVSLSIVPTHQDVDPVEIMSVDFLTDTEKATLALDFDRHGRVR